MLLHVSKGRDVLFLFWDFDISGDDLFYMIVYPQDDILDLENDWESYR